MKTSHHINIMLLGLFVAILTFPHLSFAIPFNEKHAFCTDQMNINNTNYINTKIYNECMKTADEVIPQQEAIADAFIQGLIQAKKQYAKEQKIENERYEAERKKREEAERLEEEKENKRVNDLFNAFK